MDANIKTLVFIIIFWFLLGTFISLIAQDDFFTYGGSLDDNYTISSNDFINQTTSETDSNPAGKKGITTALSVMFGFSIPEGIDIPSQILIFIRFVNWLLVIVSGLLLYRVINPFA